MVDRQAVDTLRRAGFTDYEAKVLVALLRLREADVKVISEYSGVPRTKIYDVLRKLVEEGYVAEIRSRPIRFSIIDPDTFIKKVEEKKKEEMERLLKNLSALRYMLPAFSEAKRQGENYLIKVSSPEDFIDLLKKRLGRPTIVGYTRESMPYLKGLGDENYPGPIDFILTPEELYVPLSPLGVPQREYVIVVFTNPYIMEMVRRWVLDVLASK